jgi:hypothetical protein
MTDNPNYSDESQPPPPPPSQPPPVSGSRQGGSFDADAAKAAFQGANPIDWVIMGAGVLAFILSFFPYYTVHLGGFGASGNAWHGFFGWFAALAAVAGAAVVVLSILGTSLPFPTPLVVLACFAVAALCVLIAGLTWPGGNGATGNLTGHGFGYWASLIVIVAGLGAAVLRYLNKPIPGLSS